MDHDVGVAHPQAVQVPAHSVERLGRLVGPERYAALQSEASTALEALDGARVWNISSTAHGGGVAEMLQLLCGYANDAGADTRWLVIDGDPEFFAITKRLHNRIHGVAGDEGDLGLLGKPPTTRPCSTPTWTRSTAASIATTSSSSMTPRPQAWRTT